jgi:methylglutaconyl-CoA hydratase
MKEYNTIRFAREGRVASIWLNRPEVHHAMNADMILELTGIFTRLAGDPGTDIILLRSEGANFSAGADLAWMKEGLGQDQDTLLRESRELAGLFRTVYEVPKVVVCTVQGRCLGGANGLVAAADFVLAERNTRFAFSEVKLGLIPAAIAPYVVRKTGKSRAAAWMISGIEFTAEEALAGGLVHLICENGNLGEATRTLVNNLLGGGSGAMQGIKYMLRDLDLHRTPDEIQEKTAQLIARFRISPEGQEGMRAFLEKRKPQWHGDR